MYIVAVCHIRFTLLHFTDIFVYSAGMEITLIVRKLCSSLEMDLGHVWHVRFILRASSEMDMEPIWRVRCILLNLTDVFDCSIRLEISLIRQKFCTCFEMDLGHVRHVSLSYLSLRMHLNIQSICKSLNCFGGSRYNEIFELKHT